MRNVAMSPNFPWVGEVASDLYTQTTGRAGRRRHRHGPVRRRRAAAYTGPIHLETLDQELNADNAVAFLLRDQYVLARDKDVRIDALAEAASHHVRRAARRRAARADRRSPGTSARWPPTGGCSCGAPTPRSRPCSRRSTSPAQIPPLDGADGWSFTVTNGGGNKIDSFLERAAGYDVDHRSRHRRDDGRRCASADEHRPRRGLPGVRDRQPRRAARRHEPPVRSRSTARWGSTGVTLDGQPTGLAVGAGARLERLLGSSSTSRPAPPRPRGELSGTVAHPGEVVTWTQPMAARCKRSGALSICRRPLPSDDVGMPPRRPARRAGVIGPTSRLRTLVTRDVRTRRAAHVDGASSGRSPHRAPPGASALVVEPQAGAGPRHLVQQPAARRRDVGRARSRGRRSRCW